MKRFKLKTETIRVLTGELRHVGGGWPSQDTTAPPHYSHACGGTSAGSFLDCPTALCMRN